MGGLYYKYLSGEALDGFKHYKYNSKDTNPLSVYVLHPFWDRIVLLCPRWIAPNLLTLVGFACCVTSYLLPTVYDYDFKSSTLASGSTIPGWAWLLSSVLLFLSHTLDGIDGKQARRTGNGTPLGELFDHGCDSWAAIFITCTFFNVFGIDESNGLSISAFRMYMLVWVALLCFYASHWEKYNTGILFLPWAYDLSMVAGSIMFLVSGLISVNVFRFQVLGVSFANLMEFCMYSGAVLMVPMSVVNVYKSYQDGTGKMRPLGEAMRPLYPLVVLALLGFSWALLSPNDILRADSRCFYFLTGTVFSNITCRLIVAQMTSTRCDGLNWLFIPFSAAVGTSLVIPGLPTVGELSLLYIATACATLAHLHYAVCLLIQLCDLLNIQCFRITPKKESAENGGGAATFKAASAAADSGDRASLELRRRT